MNEWKTQWIFSKWYYIFGYSIPIILLLSFITNEMMLFSLAIFMLLLFAINYSYIVYVSKKITIKNNKSLRKVFPEEKTRLFIPFENKGIIPVFYLRGNFHLYFSDESVEVLQCDETTNSYAKKQQFFMLPKGSKTEVEIDFYALKRGTAEVRTIEIDVFDFLKLFQMRLRHTGHYRGEVIVYPKAIKVSGVEKLIQKEIGEDIQTFSMYEDVTMVRENREYSTGDPFNRVNWKASARTNELQTKVFENVNLSKATFIINIQSNLDRQQLVPTISNLDHLLSQVAYVCQYATEKGISFEMYINIRMIGSSEGFHFPFNNGREHLAKALEVLARIRKASFTIPIERIISRVAMDSHHHPLILHFGPSNSVQTNVYEKIKRAGGKVVFIPYSEELDAFHKEGREAAL